MTPSSKTITHLALFTIFAAGCAERDLIDYQSFDEEITRLHVSVDSADVSVMVSDDDVSEVDIDMTYRGNKPSPSMSVTDGALKVKVGCPFSCDGDIIIKVPKSVAANLKVDSGNLDIHNIEGDVVAAADSGNIKLYNLSGDLDLDADSGNISGTVNSIMCLADVDSGNINLTFEETPSDIDIAADSGNVNLKVPEGAYKVSLKVDSGDKKLSNITKDSESPNSIRVDVDSGNIKIVGI